MRNRVFILFFLSFLISGCNEHSNKNTNTHKQTTLTSIPFNFIIKVDHPEASGSQYTISQPNSRLELHGVVDNSGEIHSVIPAGTNLQKPIQVSVSLTYDTFKYLSDNVATLERIGQNLNKSYSSLTDPNRGSIKPVKKSITLKTTVDFAQKYR